MDHGTCNANSFIRQIFTAPAAPPFNYNLVLDTTNDGNPVDALFGFLQAFVIIGSDILFGTTDLHSLTDSQASRIREYLLSIGYDADYEVIKESKIVKVYHTDGRPYLRRLNRNRLNMTFKVAKRSFDRIETVI
jgi:hypothetical protein